MIPIIIQSIPASVVGTAGLPLPKHKVSQLLQEHGIKSYPYKEVEFVLQLAKLISRAVVKLLNKKVTQVFPYGIALYPWNYKNPWELCIAETSVTYEHFLHDWYNEQARLSDTV